jgi:hypothetical protein
MTNRILWGTALLLIWTAFPSNTYAQLSLKTDLVSSYIWRGFDLNPYKEPVLQPSLTYGLNGSGLSLEVWSSFSFANKEIHEVDLLLTYKRSLGKSLDLSAGLIHYGWYWTPNFRFGDDTSHEVFVGAGLPLLLFNPYLTVFYDFTNGDGLYILLESEMSVPLLAWLDSVFHVSLGYNGGQWLSEDTDPGFSDLNLRASVPITSGPLRITPYAQYTQVLMEAIGRENFFLCGISVSLWEDGSR